MSSIGQYWSYLEYPERWHAWSSMDGFFRYQHFIRSFREVTLMPIPKECKWKFDNSSNFTQVHLRCYFGETHGDIRITLGSKMHGTNHKKWVLYMSFINQYNQYMGTAPSTFALV